MSDKDHRSSSLFTSLRRSVVRVAPSAFVDEMRPMLQRQQQQQQPAQHQHHPRNKSRPDATAAASSGAAFEISLRDKSDATAKRGFRVQVPKRMIFYTLLVFVGMPLFLFGYVEMHNRHSEEHGDHPQKHPHDNHHYDKYKVVAAVEDVEGGEDGAVEGAAAANATSTGPVGDTEKTELTGTKDTTIAVESTTGVKTEETAISDVATNATVVTEETTIPAPPGKVQGDENVSQSDTLAPASSNSTAPDNSVAVDAAETEEVSPGGDPTSAKDAVDGEQRRRFLRGFYLQITS